MSWSASLAVGVCVHERLLPRFPRKAIVSWTGEWLWVAGDLWRCAGGAAPGCTLPLTRASG